MIEYTDKTRMPSGEYKGISLGNVPAGHLLFRYREGFVTAPLKKYIEANMKALKKLERRTIRQISQ